MRKVYQKNDNKKNIESRYLIENDFICLVLAEKRQESNYGKLGMELTLKTGIEYIKENFEELYKKDVSNIKREIVLEIKRKLRLASNRKECRVDELGANLSMIGIKGKRYIYFILGDGIIYEYKEKKYEFFLNQDREKVFVTDYDSYKKAKVKKGVVVDQREIYILQNKYGKYKKINMVNNTMDKICKNLKENDEFSYIMIKIK